MFAKNTEGRTLQSEPEIKLSCLDEPLKLAREAVVLRTRLASAKRDHAELLAQRDDALREGVDVLPQVRQLFLEIDKLPAEIDQLAQRVCWLVDQGVAKLNYENSQIAARQYMKCRDNLRQALERFCEELVSVQADIKAGEDLGPSLTDLHNSKLAEIEKILGGVYFSRVIFLPLPLPPINAELVNRNQLLAALDNWIQGLH